MIQPNTSPVELPILIADTNIFGNLLDQKTLNDTFQIISELNKSYQLSISKITLQEIVSKGTKDVAGILKGLQGFRRFEVDESILLFAGLMACVGIKGNFDSIIASTAFLNNAVILTANQKDFPEPCFTETKSWSISYKDNRNRTIHQMIHLLSTNVKETAEKINNIEYVQEIMKNKPTVTTPPKPNK